MDALLWDIRQAVRLAIKHPGSRAWSSTDHSFRSAISGSIRTARRAGM
jgi:hypothetical protein